MLTLSYRYSSCYYYQHRLMTICSVNRGNRDMYRPSLLSESSNSSDRAKAWKRPMVYLRAPRRQCFDCELLGREAYVMSGALWKDTVIIADGHNGCELPLSADVQSRYTSSRSNCHELVQRPRAVGGDILKTIVWSPQGMIIGRTCKLSWQILVRTIGTLQPNIIQQCES